MRRKAKTQNAIRHGVARNRAPHQFAVCAEMVSRGFHTPEFPVRLRAPLRKSTITTEHRCAVRRRERQVCRVPAKVSHPPGGSLHRERQEMRKLLLGLAAAALIPLSVSAPPATACVGHGGIDPCVTNGDTGAALQQCEQSCNNSAPAAPAPKR